MIAQPEDTLFELDDMYALPNSTRSTGPLFKPRDLLTHEDVQSIVKHLRTLAVAQLQHADALEAWDEGRGGLGESA